MAKAQKNVIPKDPLERLQEEASLREVLALVLWKGRFQNPEMAIEITQADIDSMKASTNHTRQTPFATVWRRPAMPAVAPVPASGKNRGSSGSPATPAGDKITVLLVAKGTGSQTSAGDAIVPVESDEHDFDRGRQVAEVRRARETAGNLANALLGGIASGTYSEETMREAASSLKLLARG